MDCSAFEAGLVELMGDDLPDDLRRGKIVELRSHAAVCAACAGSVPWVDLLELPAGQREPLADPGPAYWDGLERSLDRRLTEEIAPARHLFWLPLAASVGVVALAASWLFTLRNAPDRSRPIVAQTTADAHTTTSPESAAPVPQPIEVPGSSESPGLPAGTTAPDDPAAGRGADGDEPEAGWYAAWDYEPEQAAEEDPASEPGWEETLFPDAAELDAEARAELLRWLRERTS